MVPQNLLNLLIFKTHAKISFKSYSFAGHSNENFILAFLVFSLFRTCTSWHRERVTKPLLRNLWTTATFLAVFSSNNSSFRAKSLSDAWSFAKISYSEAQTIWGKTYIDSCVSQIFLQNCMKYIILIYRTKSCGNYHHCLIIWRAI